MAWSKPKKKKPLKVAKPRNIVERVAVELGLKKTYPDRYLGGGKWSKPAKKSTAKTAKPTAKTGVAGTSHRQRVSADDMSEIMKLSDKKKNKGK